MKKTILKEIQSIRKKEDLEQFREEIEKEINTRGEVISLCETANSLKGNSFGFIKDSMENFLPKLITLREGRELFREYLSIIKESKDLTDLYNFYENIRDFNESSDAVSIIKEWKNTANASGRKELKESMKKLDEVLAKSFIWAGKESEDLIPEENRKGFYSLVEGVYGMTPDSKNMTKYFNDIAKIKEMSLEENRKNSRKIEEAMNELSKKMDGTIKESKEMPLEEQYNKAKQNCINSLNEAKTNFENENDFESSARIELYIESIDKKAFNEETASDDIEKMSELEKCFA